MRFQNRKTGHFFIFKKNVVWAKAISDYQIFKQKVFEKETWDRISSVQILQINLFSIYG